MLNISLWENEMHPSHASMLNCNKLTTSKTLLIHIMFNPMAPCSQRRWVDRRHEQGLWHTDSQHNEWPFLSAATSYGYEYIDVQHLGCFIHGRSYQESGRKQLGSSKALACHASQGKSSFCQGITTECSHKKNEFHTKMEFLRYKEKTYTYSETYRIWSWCLVKISETFFMSQPRRFIWRWLLSLYHRQITGTRIKKKQCLIFRTSTWYVTNRTNSRVYNVTVRYIAWNALYRNSKPHHHTWCKTKLKRTNICLNPSTWKNRLMPAIFEVITKNETRSSFTNHRWSQVQRTSNQFN